MSDEFLKVAHKEIQTELSKIEAVFAKCSTDKHIQDNVMNLEPPIHKIKGLAPMMGHNNIGDLASMADLILKHINKKGAFPDSYFTLLEIFQKIKILFYKDDKSVDIRDFITSTKKKISDVTKS